jgi:alkylated DNA repair dioxygenase AlkB
MFDRLARMLARQASLFGLAQPAVDTSFANVEHVELDDTSWIEFAGGWLHGADLVFDELVTVLPLRQRTDVKMFDRVVDEPRLSAWWRLDGDAVEPLPILGEIRVLLSERYGERFDSIGFNLYRDGNDSVAWHGDRHRHVVVDPIVAIVSVGEPRPLRLRPRGGGPSLAWRLGDGDLFVMGGACQHDWEHTVPKVRHAGPRMSITFRHA